MKNMFFKNIGVISAVIFALLLNPVYSEDMTDFDYDFIDNAFTKPNPATNKQFEEVMKRYEAEPNGVMYKFKRFLNRNNPEYDKNFKKQFETPGKQPLRIKDEPLAKPTVTIGGDFYDSKGKMLPAGHYQVEYKENNGQYTINLLQGQTRVAEVKAILYDDEAADTAVVYSRSENVNEKLIRIIYSNLDLTLRGYVRLK